MKTPNKETEDTWHKDPNNWVWGIFYYNKDDKRLFVDKKNPNLGATINFAHPKLYLFFVGMMCFFAFIVFMILMSKNN